MHHPIRRSVIALALLAVASAPAVAQDVAKVGDTKSYSWREAPINSQGVRSLADLRGRPAVFEFWGTG